TEPVKNGSDRLAVVGAGVVDGRPVSGKFSGGALLSLGDEKKPYPVELQVSSGATRLNLMGSIDRPMDFVGVDLTLTVEGDDLADLFVITGLPMPTSPKYRLTSEVGFAAGKIALSNLTGVVGSSDLAGSLVIDVARPQPLVTGSLTSNKVALADLAGFIGATPGVANAPNDTAEQQRQRQSDARKSTIIPDRQISLPRLRAADFQVTYAAKRIESETPLDNLRANLTLEAGRLALRPLSFGAGTGSIHSTITMDGQGDQVRLVADIRFENIDLSRILTDLTDFRGQGRVGGHAALTATGNSLAEMLARGDGALTMYMSGGDVSALLVNLAGLDLASSMFSMLGLPSRAPLRCMVTDFGLAAGVLTARKLLFDTTQANILGAGSIDLRAEEVSMRITTEPKFPSIARLPLPIDITGPLKSPRFGPGLNLQFDSNPLLGILGLLSIQLGQGKDHDCAALLRDIKAAP
ncbi:MAG: AsmA family protein, partial [Elsteraceae bacterium]